MERAENFVIPEKFLARLLDSLALASLRARPARAGLAASGVGLGVLLVAMTSGLVHGMQSDAIERQTRVSAEIMLCPSGTFSPVTGKAFGLEAEYARALTAGSARVRRVEGITAASPVGQFLQGTDSGIAFDVLEGVDFQTYAQVSPIQIVDGAAPRDFEVAIDRRFQQTRKDDAGKPLEVGSQITILGRPMRVAAVYEPSAGASIKLPLTTLQKLTIGGGDRCSFVLIKCEPGIDPDDVAGRIAAAVPGLRIIMTRDLPTIMQGSIASLEVFLSVVRWLGCVISLLVVGIALYSSIHERRREIAILKCLGASRTAIITQVQAEALLVSALGVASGMLVAVAGKVALESLTVLRVDLDLVWIVAAATIGLSGGALGAFIPAIQASRLDPVTLLAD